MEDLIQLAGRQWPVDHKNFNISAKETAIPAIEKEHCNRCGSLVTGALPNGEQYCRECIGLGRICSSDYLIRVADNEIFPTLKNGGLTWKGTLTDLQKNVSEQLVSNFFDHQNSLVHAVTGAGKTEMMFALIAACLSQGGRACIATPRIDVVNELYPRFKEAFILVKIGKYHGREYKDAEHERLTICTTHQLLKFYQAFDLLVIDEVDSFPYVENPQLHFAAKNAVKKEGVRVYLTATPTEDLLQEVKSGKIKILKLNRRFHGGLLPVPREKLFLRPFVKKNKVNPNLIKEIIKVIKAGHPLLLFVPRIEEIPIYLESLKQVKDLQTVKMAGVHAGDPNRLKKVEQFRNHQLQLLITTTILERGVTFKHVWVIIIAADDPIYTTASLVQIAGRVGRDKNDRDGLVLYCYHKYTAKIAAAIKQIREMNQ